jgi:hypothetical protein
LEADVDLVRDVLDKLLLDRNRQEIGRVDGIALERRDAAAPRVVGLDVGLGVIGRRLGRVPGRLAEGVEHAIGLGGLRPLRIPFSAVSEIDRELRVDVLADETPATAIERQLRMLVGGRSSRKPPASDAWVAETIRPELVERRDPDRRELRVEQLLGRKVFGANQKVIGRLEEIRATRHGSGCTVSEYVIGSAGLLERLGLGVRLLLGRQIGGGLIADWHQLDVSTPERPALTCAASDLRRE